METTTSSQGHKKTPSRRLLLVALVPPEIFEFHVVVSPLVFAAISRVRSRSWCYLRSPPGACVCPTSQYITSARRERARHARITIFLPLRPPLPRQCAINDDNLDPSRPYLEHRHFRRRLPAELPYRSQVIVTRRLLLHPRHDARQLLQTRQQNTCRCPWTIFSGKNLNSESVRVNREALLAVHVGSWVQYVMVCRFDEGKQATEQHNVVAQTPTRCTFLQQVSQGWRSWRWNEEEGSAEGHEVLKDSNKTNSFGRVSACRDRWTLVVTWVAFRSAY